MVEIFIKKGQSMLEYAVLICVVLSALMIMHVYVKRAYQGRLKQEADSLGQQYSPPFSSSHIRTTTSTNNVTYTGGETDSLDLQGDLIPDGKDVPDGVSVTFTETDTLFQRSEQIESFAREDQE